MPRQKEDPIKALNLTPTFVADNLKEPRFLGFCCRIGLALRFIVVLELTLTLSVGASGVREFLLHPGGRIPALVLLLAVCCVSFASQAMVFVALHSVRRFCLVPYLVWKVFQSAFIAAGIGYLVVLYHYFQECPELFAAILGVLSLYFLLGLSFLWTTIQAMQFLKHKRVALYRQRTLVQFADAICEQAGAPPPYE